MFNKGEIIIYGNSGVCEVTDIGVPEIGGIDPSKSYYTLKPVFEAGMIYIPVNTQAFMRHTMSHDDAMKLIGKIHEISDEIYDNRNLNLLKEHYKTLLESYQCKDLIQIIKAVYAKEQRGLKIGKKLGQVDKFYMKKAEDMLHGEFAVALGIAKNDVKSFIESKVKELYDKKADMKQDSKSDIIATKARNMDNVSYDEGLSVGIA